MLNNLKIAILDVANISVKSNIYLFPLKIAPIIIVFTVARNKISQVEYGLAETVILALLAFCHMTLLAKATLKAMLDDEDEKQKSSKGTFQKLRENDYFSDGLFWGILFYSGSIIFRRFFLGN